MSKWVKAAKVQDVSEGTGVVSECAGKSIALFHVEGDFYAIDNTCPHKGGPLGEGELEGCVVTCPWHAWEFNVTTGCNPDNEKVEVKTYAVKVEGEDVLVEI